MKTWKDINIDLPDEFEGERLALCPQCSHTRKKSKVKCLSANGETKLYKCFHCGFSGSLKDGVYSKSNPEEYFKQEKFIRPDYKAQLDLPEKVIKYFNERGISTRILALNKIGYGKVYMPQLQGFTTVIQFPYFRDGELINIKSRDANKNFRMESGAERILYNIDGVPKNEKKLTIVEGELDCLSVQEAGIASVVSIPDGAPSPKAKNYDSKFQFLENAIEWLENFNEFILAVDNDAPGKLLEKELARRLGVEKCKTVTWPEGCKDANDVLISYGPEEVSKCLSDAKEYPINGLFEIKDFKGELFNLYENGFERGNKTGWYTLDDYYTVRPGELTIIGGIPGHGKTSWLTALVVNLSKNQWKIGLYSPEQLPLQRYAASIIEVLSGKTFKVGHTNRIEKSMLEEYYYDLANYHFKFIMPDDNSPQTLDEILRLAKLAVLKYGIKGLVIDPWNLMEHQRPQGMTETEYISESLTKLTNFARSKNIHIWMVVHPTKLPKTAEGTYRPPTAYDLSGSSHWNNKAFNILTVHREKRGHEDDDYRTQIHIQKIKFKEIGCLGVVELQFDRYTGKYYDIQ